jgi:stearoyl-CoA desaturase (delta-9 desaturase)
MHAAPEASLPWHEIYFGRRTADFWGVHLAALVGIAALGWSWTGMALAITLYVPRMFFATAAYHRYFSHRSFRTSRVFQFLLALGAVSTGERGVLWWASHHRRHHRYSDRPGDLHSPREGFWWSHMGWMLSGRQATTDLENVKDLAKYPELRLLERFHYVPVIVAGLVTWALGGTFGLVWGGFASQVLFWHGTFTINSLSHLFGSRRYATRDDSRNNWLLAILTMGEGWHNNHHHRPGRARQGVRWWELDVTYYVLRALAAVGLIWDLRGTADTTATRGGLSDNAQAAPSIGSGRPSPRVQPSRSTFASQ